MSRVTLNDFFGVSVNGFWQDVRPELLAALRGSGLTRLTAAQWPTIVSGIIDKAKDLFDIDVAAIIVPAWSKYRELRQYADPKKHPPEECNLVPLAKHTLAVTYHPYLEVLFNGAPLGKLVFDVTLALELEGFVLTIQDGRIMKVHTGTCEGKGRIEFKDCVLVEKSLTKITLPGTFDLGQGMSLRRSDDKGAQETEVLSGSSNSKAEISGREIAPEEAVEKFSFPSRPIDGENRLAEAYLQGLL